MTCPKCGNPLNDRAVFCPKCGCRVEISANNVPILPIVNNAVANTVATGNVQKKSKTWKVVLLTVAATIVAGFVGSISLSSNLATDSENVALSEWDASVCTSYDYDDLKYVTYVEKSDKSIYGLSDSRNYGVVGAVSNTNTRVELEAIYGVRLNIKDGAVWYSTYKHSSSVSETAKIALYEMHGFDKTFIRNLGSVTVDTDRKLNVKLSDDVIYILGASFEINGMENFQECYGYLYQHDGEIQTCRICIWPTFVQEDRMEKWDNLMKDADPKDYLSNGKVTYPTSGTGNACNHVEEWEAISDEIILHDDWSDEMKVFAFVDYLSKNVAYDSYRLNQKGNASRASLAGDYTKDKYFTLGNNVGVCWDFTNILSIMCRHHGIPCTSVENAEHAVNAVWLHDEWVSIDLTETAKYKCYQENTDKSLWTKKPNASYYNYGTPVDNCGFNTHDDSIWTREKGLGLK